MISNVQVVSSEDPTLPLIHIASGDLGQTSLDVSCHVLSSDYWLYRTQPPGN